MTTTKAAADTILIFNIFLFVLPQKITEPLDVISKYFSPSAANYQPPFQQMQIADLTSLLKIKIQMGSVEVFIQRRMTTESYLRRALAAGVTRLGVQQNIKKNNWSNTLTAQNINRI